MPRALILTGADRYEIRWHDHAATSQRIAELLRDLDIDGRLRATHPRAFIDLDAYDLVIVNAGNGMAGPEDATDDDWRPAHVVFSAWLDAGGPVVALHNSVSAFTDMPGWTDHLGGEWVRGTTMHPPISETLISVKSDAHPITAGLSDFAVFDERYSFMTVAPDNAVLADHEHDGQRHPLAWARVSHGGRVVFDGLGHDVRSFDAEGHQRLLRRSVAWALGLSDDRIAGI